MKRAGCLASLIFLACSLSVCGQQSKPTNLTSIANSIVDLLVKGDYSRVVRNFDGAMKAAMPEEKLRENWEALVALVGPYRKGLGARTETVEQDGKRLDAVVVRREHEYSRLEIRIIFSAAKRITGLQFTPAENPPSEYAIDPALVALANDFVGSLKQGDFTSPMKYFDESAKVPMSASDLQDLWKSVVVESGPFKRQIGSRLETAEQDGQTTWGLFVTCEFEKSTMDLLLSFNSAMRVTSVHFVPVVSPPASAMTSGVLALVKPAAPDAQLVAPADEFLGSLAKGDYARAVTCTTDAANGSAAVEKYQKLWEGIVAGAGQFRRRTGARAGTPIPGANRLISAFFTCEFENSTRTFHMLFNSAKRIRGFLALGDDAAAQVAVGPYAEAVTDLLVKGDYATVVASFDDTMKSALPESKLKETWESVLTQSGPFKRRAGTRALKMPPYDVAFVKCEFERADLEVQISFNRSMQVSGLFVRPPKGGSAPK